MRCVGIPLGSHVCHFRGTIYNVVYVTVVAPKKVKFFGIFSLILYGVRLILCSIKDEKEGAGDSLTFFSTSLSSSSLSLCLHTLLGNVFALQGPESSLLRRQFRSSDFP